MLRDGPGGKYLVQHSAESGKTNSIAWTAHFLAELHDAQNAKLFDSVLVVSDHDKESGPDPFTEHSQALNPNLRGRDIRQAFRGSDYQILLVANKFQMVSAAAREASGPTEISSVATQATVSTRARIEDAPGRAADGRVDIRNLMEFGPCNAVQTQRHTRFGRNLRGFSRSGCNQSANRAAKVPGKTDLVALRPSLIRTAFCVP